MLLGRGEPLGEHFLVGAVPFSLTDPFPPTSIQVAMSDDDGYLDIMVTTEAKRVLPDFIYGTAWKEDRTEGLVDGALEAGFRAIDTANQRKHYFEEGVGKAIRRAIEAGRVGRDELFLQTKFTFIDGQDHRLPYDPQAPVGEQVQQSFQSSLEHLGVNFIDSYLLHGPSRQVGLARADWEAWRAMEALHVDGRAGRIGLSNVSREQLLAFVEGADIKPAFVQNRCFARFGWDAAVRDECRARDIVYQGFSLLTANRYVLGAPELQVVAARHAVTPSLVIFRFAQQLGMLPLTGTTDPGHMRIDLAASEFSLSEAEISLVASL